MEILMRQQGLAEEAYTVRAAPFPEPSELLEIAYPTAGRCTC